MTAFWLRADDVLRLRWTHFDGDAVRRSSQLAIYAVVCGGFYGAVMGTFGGVTGERLLQVAYSTTKVPVLLGGSFVLSLPSFYVFQSLLGLRADFGRSMHALLATQAAMAIILASLGPLVAVWYTTSDDYPRAVFVNGVVFAIASVSAQRILKRHYRDLIARDARHRWSLAAWLAVYIFVAIQLAWTLRPFIGDPGAEVQFFRRETWGNAYLRLFELVRVVLWGQ
jgi:hypothetical protein